MTAITSLLATVCLALRSAVAHCVPIPSAQRDIQGKGNLQASSSNWATHLEPRGTESNTSTPSAASSFLAQSTGTSSQSYGVIVLTGISFLCLNGIIALCLVWAKQLRGAKKVALRAGVELPAGTYPAELKGNGVHEMDCAPPELTEDALHEMHVQPPELTEDALHEMHVQPPELTGNMWPELDERPAKVSVSRTV